MILIRLERLYGMITDLYIDHNKFKVKLLLKIKNNLSILSSGLRDKGTGFGNRADEGDGLGR